MDSPPPDLRDDGVICLAPWTHLHIRINGTVAPCCMWEGSLGNINDRGLGETWNSEPSRRLRLALRGGQRLASCRHCLDLEASGASSVRQAMNRDLAHHAARLGAMAADGTLLAPPATFDIRFSNLCNFRCRSCYHGASSRWYSDAVALNEACAAVPLIEAAGDSEKLLAELSLIIPEVEEIYFAGGEPLLHDNHFVLLEMLLAQGRSDVVLKYNTNLSVLDFKHQDICAVWRKFANVHVRASIDAAGQRGEIIRDGFIWSRAVDNLCRVRRDSAHVKLVTDTTVSVLNVLHLPDLQNALLATGTLSLGDLELHILQTPEIYNVRVLPPELKQEALRRLSAHVGSLRAVPRDDHRGIGLQEQQFNQLSRYMLSEDWSRLLSDFRTRTRRLDSMRGQSTVEVLPELSILFDELPATSSSTPDHTARKRL